METTQQPKHVAIVMDGNGRWAERRRRPRTLGHQAGVRAVRATVEHCMNLNIQSLTLFAFSSENWNRPKSEINRLMELFLRSLKKEGNALHENGVRVRFIGDTVAFSDELRSGIARLEKLTEKNRSLMLNIAANYGGRWDITQAARELGRKVAKGELSWQQIEETDLAAALTLADLPEPDLFIRTGGEQRISNFLLWQLAYTELHFTHTLWPDFDAAALDEAVAAYTHRERRFGQTSAQVAHSVTHA